MLSFLPMAALVRFGAFWVFFITSLLAACYDGMFVIMQRHNRPRIIQTDQQILGININALRLTMFPRFSDRFQPRRGQRGIDFGVCV